jgi:acetyl esterase/lipase
MAQVAIERDVVFGVGGERELHCNVHSPAGGGDKRTALVFFHGGGFVGGSKDSIDARVGHYAELGYVCVAAEYRLAPDAKWPSQIHDAKAAIRWTRANAESLGVDPARIGVAGFSAGGLLALVAAGTPDQPELEGDGGNASVSSAVAACLAYYPAVHMGLDSPDHPLMPAGSGEAEWERVRPTTYVSATFRPTVLFHGTADVTIPMESSVRFFDKLREAGVPAEFHAIDGAPHAFDRHAELGEACAHFADLFIDRHVINPRVYPPFGAAAPAAGTA